jgi:hypothetical protein
MVGYRLCSGRWKAKGKKKRMAKEEKRISSSKL